MTRRVILTIGKGSFKQGFPVILRIGKNNAITETELEIHGELPSAPNIPKLVDSWQQSYYQVVMPYSRIKPKLGQVTNVSCSHLGDELAHYLNHWLNSGSIEWQKIRDGLQRNLRETEEIQVLIQTDNNRLRQLPWHTWDLFANHYTKSEIALSAPEYKQQNNLASPTKKVKILAVLGDSTGINVQKDQAIINQLPHTEPLFLEEPQRQDLSNQLWDQKWQILFFAGHSCSQEEGSTGKIYINSTDSLSIAEFKNGLRRAIAHGLQLAIFNSCDGLGLARELADLQIPQIIVMREPVPDLVAQEFLKYFLTSFAQGKSLYLSVREARERLEGLQSKFPFASWLPVICQNPAVEPLTWEKLRRGNVGDRNHIIQRLYKSSLLLLISFISTWTITIVRNNEFLLPAWRNFSGANHWKLEFFGNSDLMGTPLTIQDLGDSSKNLSFNWGPDAPNRYTPPENFSVRIKAMRYFAPGRHVIKAKADDGVRVWVDQQMLIDQWSEAHVDFHCNYFESKGGNYPVEVNYRELGVLSYLSFEIRPENSASISDCKFQRTETALEIESSVLCKGESCIGRDPHDNKCDVSPESQIVTSTIGNFQFSEGNLGSFQVRMKYSKECNATWVWSTAPFRSTHYLEDRQGNQYGKADIPQDGSSYHYSDMGPGDIELRACAQAPNEKPKCTNFVKP